MFDLADMAREHVLELARRTHGWGTSTEEGVRRLKRLFDFAGVVALYPELPTRKKREPFPGENPKGTGCGNGVAMKMGPLAIASITNGYDLRDLLAWCRDLGRLTHPNQRAWTAAYALAWCIRDRLLAERPIVNEQDGRDMLRRLVEELDLHERRYHDRVSDRLRILQNPGVLASAEALREATGTSCYALESVPFAIGCFLRHPTDIRAGTLETLNAGGDTDTNVNMYAQVAATNAGIDAIPNDWREQITDARQALAIGTALARMTNGTFRYTSKQLFP